MSADQRVLDATKCVELYHFRGTSIVACCLTTTDGRAVLGTACGEPGEPFDSTAVSAQARNNANKELARLLNQTVAERSC